jgi:hypothetical protein
MIKVDFWSDEKIGSVSLIGRLLFIGSWTLADDSGVCRAHPMFLKNQLFPYDEKITKQNIENALNELAESGLVSYIDSQDETYIYINNFNKHQLIGRPSDHRFIEVEADDYTALIEHSLSNHCTLKRKVKVKVKVNVKENINRVKSECLKIWNETLSRNSAKYPGIDYDLQRDLILQWISDTPKKSLKKSNWNLFIQNWLSRVRPKFNYQNNYRRPEIRQNEEPAKPLTDEQRKQIELEDRQRIVANLEALERQGKLPADAKVKLDCYRAELAK